MNSPSVLSLRGLCRDYAAGGRVLNVLTGIDLDVQPGEVVGLIGPSGSGKSSLLHAAGLLETPSAGQVLLSGVDYTGASDRDRTRARLQYLGFVYQFHHLLPELSALDNAAWPMRIAGVSRQDARLRAKTSLIALGLGERLDHQPAQLSGGEQQRVAIARALSHGPKLILADEPTGNLDPDTSRTVFAALAESARQGGTAALIATHNHELAAHMDRVFALEHGKLKAIS